LQVSRQTGPLLLRFVRFGRDGWKLGFHPCEIDLEVLEAKVELIVIQPLGTPAELVALQLFDDEVEALDLGLCLAERGALGCERTHQLLQGSHIVRQSGEVDVHEDGV